MIWCGQYTFGRIFKDQDVFIELKQNADPVPTLQALENIRATMDMFSHYVSIARDNGIIQTLKCVNNCSLFRGQPNLAQKEWHRVLAHYLQIEL